MFGHVHAEKYFGCIISVTFKIRCYVQTLNQPGNKSLIAFAPQHKETLRRIKLYQLPLLHW